MFNVTQLLPDRDLHSKKATKKAKIKMNYRSTGLVADSSRPWLRGFLGEPL